MEPINVFILDGSYYSISFGSFSSNTNLIGLINKNPISTWSTSNVATSLGDVIKDDIRSSLEYPTHMHLIDRLDIKFWEQVMKMVPSYLKSAVDFTKYYSVRILAYRPGDFFAKHVDSKKNNICTCLIFPPVKHDNMLAHIGGLLRIEKPDGSIFEFDSSKNTKWTIVMFEPTLPHECLPVESGLRIVIKVELKYNKLFELISNEKTIYDFDTYYQLTNLGDLLELKKKELSNNINTFKSELINLIDSMSSDDLVVEMQNLISIKEDESYYDYEDDDTCSSSKIFKLCKSSYPDISTMLSEYNDLNSNNYKYDSSIESTRSYASELIAKINSRKNQSMAIVVLKTYYPILDIRNLYKCDFELMKNLYQTYTNVKLQNVKIETMLLYEMGQGLQSSLFGINENVQNDIVFYQADLKFTGKITDKRSEYNDQDYDTIYEKNITCIIITK